MFVGRLPGVAAASQPYRRAILLCPVGAVSESRFARELWGRLVGSHVEPRGTRQAW